MRCLAGSFARETLTSISVETTFHFVIISIDGRTNSWQLLDPLDFSHTDFPRLQIVRPQILLMRDACDNVDISTNNLKLTCDCVTPQMDRIVPKINFSTFCWFWHFYSTAEAIQVLLYENVLLNLLECSRYCAVCTVHTADPVGFERWIQDSIWSATREDTRNCNCELVLLATSVERLISRFAFNNESGDGIHLAIEIVIIRYNDTWLSRTHMIAINEKFKCRREFVANWCVRDDDIVAFIFTHICMQNADIPTTPYSYRYQSTHFVRDKREHERIITIMTDLSG